ncbi:MAG: cytochrome c biogenesis protein CcsA, partial [Fidelibacterota bacterium]
MSGLINFLNTALPVLYLLAAAAYGLQFFRNHPLATKLASPILQGVVIVHLFEITARSFVYKHFPMASIYEAMSVIALAMAIVYIFIETRIKVKSTGFFILIFIFAFQFFSSLFISLSNQINPILKSPLLAVHSSSAILGYSAFAISAIYGLMYLLLFYNL